MYKLKDLTGQKFGLLTAVSIASRCVSRSGEKRAGTKWLCKCDCGRSHIVVSSNLQNGQVKSCGCMRLKWISEAKRTHGCAKHDKVTTEYRSWTSMLSRCRDKNVPHFHHYGGRGIAVCERWRNSFENFLDDMGKKPPGTSLDRWPDKNGNYEPSNCRWSSKREQSNNKRNNRPIEYRGVTKNIIEWCRDLNLSKRVISWRFHNGYSVEKAFETPCAEFREWNAKKIILPH